MRLQIDAFRLCCEKCPIGIHYKFIDFVLVHFWFAEGNIHEKVKSVESQRHGKVYDNRRDESVIWSEDSQDDHANNRNEKPGYRSPHGKLGYHFLGKVVDHGKEGKLW